MGDRGRGGGGYKQCSAILTPPMFYSGSIFSYDSDFDHYLLHLDSF